MSPTKDVTVFANRVIANIISKYVVNWCTMNPSCHGTGIHMFIGKDTQENVHVMVKVKTGGTQLPARDYQQEQEP